MKSIQTKFLLITISAILICAISMGFIGYSTVERLSRTQSEQIMLSTVAEQSSKYAQIFDDIEHTTKILEGYTKDRIPNIATLKQPGFADRFVARAHNNIANLANKSKYASSIYVRFNPKYTSGTAGIFLVRNNLIITDQDNIKNSWLMVTPTDITKNEKTHPELLTWWLEPIAKGKASWLPPHHDHSLNDNVISYVSPFYVGEELAGIVGVDVRFSLITAPLKSINVYKTGSAFLADEAGHIIYHPQQSIPVVKQRIKNDKNTIASKLELKQVDNKILTFTNAENIDVMFAYKYLNNGMHLIIGASLEEINAERTSMTRNMLISTIIIVLMLTFITIVFTNKLVAPIRSLTYASEQIARGYLDNVNFPETKSDDEIGRLTESLRKTVLSLRKYISRVNGLAYQDAMTGIKNRTAFLEAAAKLDLEIVHNTARFAVIVFDVNNLKVVNDSLGHEYGDKLIILASKIICPIFKHSPVFRIGGDEFTAILTGDDYNNREQLIKEFNQRVNDGIETNMNFKLIIAAGMAEYNENIDIYFDDVFNRADKDMYNNKRNLKKQE